jgi:hypothetical protein
MERTFSVFSEKIEVEGIRGLAPPFLVSSELPTVVAGA